MQVSWDRKTLFTHIICHLSSLGFLEKCPPYYLFYRDYFCPGGLHSRVLYFLHPIWLPWSPNSAVILGLFFVILLSRIACCLGPSFIFLFYWNINSCSCLGRAEWAFLSPWYLQECVFNPHRILTVYMGIEF